MKKYIVHSLIAMAFGIPVLYKVILMCQQLTLILLNYERLSQLHLPLVFLLIYFSFCYYFVIFCYIFFNQNKKIMLKTGKKFFLVIIIA
ncbi:hypothetical protein D8B46_09805 [Candidatus Gracilibacteria bacterium]|nr:MAG: hypothetical protein D8B46_09805 [Candidatus Gracilibacteria bacterium]